MMQFVTILSGRMGRNEMQIDENRSTFVIYQLRFLISKNMWGSEVDV